MKFIPRIRRNVLCKGKGFCLHVPYREEIFSVWGHKSIGKYGSNRNYYFFGGRFILSFIPVSV